MKIEDIQEALNYYTDLCEMLGNCDIDNRVCRTAIEALEKQVNGELIERVYCMDCKHSSTEDALRVYCAIKGQLSNKKSFCEAMERK